MPLIAMNREIGSLGKDVAKGVAAALGLKVEHHEMIDHLANRARVRKSHVVSFLEGSQGLIERLTTDRVSVDQCVDEIVRMVKSPQFTETDESRAKLCDLAVAHHVRATLRTHASTSHCMVRVTAANGKVTLEGVVDNADEVRACTDLASRLKGVTEVQNLMRTRDVPARLRGD